MDDEGLCQADESQFSFICFPNLSYWHGSNAAAWIAVRVIDSQPLFSSVFRW